MKKVILIALASFGIMAANAQQAIETPSFDANWSLGIDAGGTTTLQKHKSFLREMRGAVGLHLQKKLSPAFALGAEAAWSVNTSKWYGYRTSTMFDNSYVGVYGAINLHNLFGGFVCEGRKFDIEITGGAGWGHSYANAGPNQDGPKDYNFFATKMGLNFNFNINEHITLSIKPSVSWNMTGGKYQSLDIEQTSAGSPRHLATFNILGGFTYNFGPTFKCADTDRGEIDALNAKINSLRNELDACLAATAANEARAAALAAELEACKNRKPEVVKQTRVIAWRAVRRWAKAVEGFPRPFFPILPPAGNGRIVTAGSYRRNRLLFNPDFHLLPCFLQGRIEEGIFFYLLCYAMLCYAILCCAMCTGCNIFGDKCYIITS